ncbi:Bgt-4013 [Blumeria graminis f. sp. tritici]|uniref:Bgt-4013 n=2 Tax=Blumeria graminis f. sp. tritici TaxID=62690 RepID=A0A381LA29_BLUGR|nr:GTPase activating protein [Blumeria graminis f. sp. tritici 96224]VDB89292.1 Bgt-4013 [Blumeria graminis f. sp. tritici]
MSAEFRAPSSLQASFANPQPTPSHGINGAHAASPPSKASLKTWWKNIRDPTSKNSTDHQGKYTFPNEFEKTGEHPAGIFGVPLRQSITYANVAISLVDSEGKSYIYGYVPIVVAKCGVFLKEKGM